MRPVYLRAEFTVEPAPAARGGSTMVMVVNDVEPPRRPYRQTCPYTTFAAIVRWIDVDAGRMFTEHELAKDAKLPFTAVHVAISFLIERGIIDKRTRRSPLTSLTDDVYADGMTEWHAALDTTLKGQTP